MRAFLELDQYISWGGTYWKDGEQVSALDYGKAGVTFVPRRARLADLLGIPHEYLADSHMPKDFELDKKVHIQNFGMVHIRVYKSGCSPSGGLLRVYIDCPVCQRHLPMGRLWQHIRTHATSECVTCGKVVRMSKLYKHVKHCMSNG
jgi:hypothetical protein